MVIIVFVPSDQMLWELDQELRFDGFDTIMCDHHDTTMLEKINDKSTRRPVILLMRP
jgi:uncharacterized protein with PIN domain